MECDFLIIGGGVAGLSAAAHVAELGAAILVEAEDSLGYHTSGRSAALFDETYGKASTIALNRASRAYHAEEADVLSPRGLMLLGSDDDTAFETSMATMKLAEIGVPAATDKVPILNPDHVRRAAFTADAWDIDTDRLMSGYARTARGHGAQVLTHAPVAQITRTEGGWRVRAGPHEIAARILINAAGAWADAVATLAGRAPLGIQPFRRSMARIVAPGRHDTRAWPMLFGPGEAWYAKPDAGALLVSPAEEDPLPPQDAWAEDLVIAEGLARYQAHVTIPVTRPTTTWAGLRSFAPDRQLVIGPDPDDPAFFWLAGQGGYGMQSSPAAGRLTADLLAGRTPELDAATLASLNPARFS